MRLATGPNLKYTPVYPPFLPTLLICCCILFFFYHLVPSFTTATDDIATLLVDNLNLRPSGSNACTKEIGTAQCCSLFLEATPCLDECRKLHIHDTSTLGEQGPIFRCVGCGYRMCTAHTPIVPFHENETCAEYDKRIETEKEEEEAASVALLKEKAQKCPGCGSQIEKTTGCDRMTCKCGFEFCYVCRAPYAGPQGIRALGNSAHREDCQYHTARLLAHEETVFEL
ncbi:hypothetical protein BM1_07203 [Bipolaris maydis]|nr:hypothetical protein BM1_07203 [Bipolaris maydis]